MASSSHRRNLAAQIRTLSDYQTAISTETSTLSDSYAKDFNAICVQVSEIVETFLDDTETTEQELTSWLNLPSVKVPAVSLPSVETMTRVSNSLARIFQTYIQYQKLQDQRNRSRSKKRKHSSKPATMSIVEWSCEHCTYINRSSITEETSVATCEMCFKESRVARDNSETTVSESMFSFSNVETVAATAAVIGGTVKAAQSVLHSRALDQKVTEAAKCREGEEGVYNGDFTPVAPSNTARLIAADADTIVHNIQTTGVNVPNEIRSTGEQVRALAAKMTSCLLAIEEYYDNAKSREQWKAMLFLLGSGIFGSFLLHDSRSLLQRAAVISYLGAAGVFFPKVNKKLVAKTRDKAKSLVADIERIQSNATRNKLAMKAMVSEAVKVTAESNRARRTMVKSEQRSEKERVRVPA